MGSRRAASLPIFVCGLTLACTSMRTSSPESLGYGPSDHELGHGYVERGVPFERPPPAAWLLADLPPTWSLTPIVASPTLPVREVPGDLQLLCMHATEVLAAGAGSGFDPAAALAVCHVLGRTARLARTSENWSGYFGCVLAGKSLDELDACSEAFPTYFAIQLQRSEKHELDVCEHIIITTLIEETNDERIRESAELDPFVPIVDECVTRLIAEEQAKRTPEAYDALLDCVLAQSSSAAMEACQ